MEIAQISIGTGLDLTGAMRDLQRFGAMPKADIKITPQVDDRQLTALNKHLDLKQRHIRQVAADFKSNVIRPIVDERALGQLNKSLDQTQARLVNVVRLAQQLKGIGNISVNASTSSSSGSSPVDEKMADAIGKAVARHSKPGLAGRAAAFAGRAAGGVGAIAGQVGQSLLFGVSQEVTKNFGKGLSVSIEKSIGGSLGSTELVGGKIGDAMSGAIAKRLGASLPKEISEAIKNAIGEDDILKAGLFERSKQRASTSRRAEPIQSEAIAQRRDLLRQRFDVRREADGIVNGIRQTQSDVARRENVRNVLQGRQSRAAAGGATVEKLEQYDKTIAALNSEILQLIEREQSLTDSLGSANEGLRRLDEEIKKSKDIRQKVSPDAMPDFYQQALQQMGGAGALKNAPKLVVEDAKLKAQGARAAYGVESNTLQITSEMDEALKAGKLTIEQMTTLFHELQHAIQYDFGSAAGIDASAQGRILNKPVKPTPAEIKEIAPLINRYEPKDRLSEVDAEVTGRRMAAKAYEAQEMQRAKAALESRVGYGGVTGSSVADGQINSVAAQLQGIRTIAATLEVDVNDDIGAIATSFGSLAAGLQDSIDKILSVDKLSSGEIDALSEQVSKQFEQLFKLQNITTAYQKKFVTRGRALKVGKDARDGGQEKIGDVKAILDRVSATSFDLNIAVGKKFGTIQTAYEALSDELNAIYEAAKTNKTIGTTEIRSLFDGKAEEIEALEVAALKYKKQFDTRAKATRVYRAVADPMAQGARIASGTAIGLGRATRTISDTPQAQAFLAAATGATKAIGAVAKTGYQIAEGFESVALDLIPMGRSIKAVGKQLALPAATFAAATHMLPGGGAMAEGMTQMMGGALSPLGNAASSGGTQAAAEIIKHILPDIFGMQSGAIGGASAMIEAATQAATSGAASALTAVLGGKALQTAATLPLKAAAGQTPFMLTSSREKELLPVSSDSSSIVATQKAQIEKQNKKLAIKAVRAAGWTVRNALDDAEQTLDVIAKSVGSGVAIASGGVDQAKNIGEQFSKAYATIKDQSKQGNAEMAKAYALNLVQMADKATEEINKIINDLKANGADGFASELGGKLQGIKGQIARKRNLSQKMVEKSGTAKPYIDVPSSDADEIEKQRLDLSRVKGEGAQQTNELLKQAENAADKAEAAIARIGKTSENAFSQSISGLNEAIAAFERGEPPVSILKDALGGLGKVGGFVLKGLAAFTALSFLAPMFTDFAKSSVTAAMEMEKFERSMTFVTGSAAKTQQTFAALRAESKAMGTDFRGAIAGQSKLAAATKGTSLEGSATEQIGSAARQASSVFGLNAEEADRVNLAISQMASKGKISAEELRQQLGEVLPGAFQMFARSIGVTSAQLDGMLQRGEVGTQSLIAFASQLKAETSTGVAGAANSAQASLNRFNNEVYAMQTAFGKAVLPVQSLGLGMLTKALEALGVILPVVTAASIGFAVKGLGSIAIGAISSGAAMGGLMKTMIALPGTLMKAAVAFAPMAAQALVFVAIADAIGVMGKMFGETEGASKDFADSATKGLENYLKLTGQATDETKKLADSINALPKSYGEDTMLGGLARGVAGDSGTKFLRQREEDMSRGGGIGTGADIARLFGRMSGTGESGSNPLFQSRANNEARDIFEQNQKANQAAIKSQAAMDAQLSRYRQGGGNIRQVRDVDVRMRDLAAKRGMLGAGDDAGRAAIDKEYQQLAADREKLAEGINALNATVRGDLEARKAANKQIEAQLANGGLGKLEQDILNSQLKKNTEEIERGEASLKEYGKAINTAITGAARLEAQLQGINAAAEFRGNRNEIGNAQMQQAIALGQTNGQLTPGQAQSATNASEQAALIQSNESLNATMTQLTNLLQDPATSRAFGLSGLSSSSSSADIAKYIADYSGDTESEEYKILQQAQNQKQQLEQLQLQAAQGSAQLAQSQQQAQESVRQTTKEVNDFVRGIGEQMEDITRTIEQADLDTQMQNTRNDLQRNLSGFSDRFFGDFIGGIDEMITLINEPLQRMNEAQGTIAGMNRTLAETQRSGAEMMRNAQGGAMGMMGGATVPFQGIQVTSPVDASGEPGLDYVVADGQRGAQFGAVAAGTVIEAVTGKAELTNGERGYGNQVIVRTVDTVTGEFVDMLYAHLDDVAVQVGQQVGIGSVLGTQGRTGSTTGAHVSLDFFGKDSNQTTNAGLAMRDRIAAQLAAGGGALNSQIGQARQQASNNTIPSANFSTNAAVSGGAGSVSLNDPTVRTAIQFYLGQGYSPEGAAYMVGNLLQESNLDPTAVGDNGSARGLSQVVGERQRGLPSGFMEQLAFVPQEFERDTPGITDAFKGRDINAIRESIRGAERYGHEGERFSMGAQLLAEMQQSGGLPSMSVGTGGTAFSVPGADTSSINPAISALGGAINQNTESIMAKVRAQNEGSAIALRQKIQASQEKLEKAQREIIDSAREYSERYQDSILAAFGDNPISQAMQQLTADARESDAQTRQAALEINDATISLEKLIATRDQIANDPNLAPLKELIPGMDAAIANYNISIDALELARDREQRILMDRREAILRNVEETGRAELEALTRQNEDLRLEQQQLAVRDPQVQGLMTGRSQRTEVTRSFEDDSRALIQKIADVQRGLDRLKEDGINIDPTAISVAENELANLNAQLDAVEQNRDLRLVLIDQQQIELMRQFNKEQDAALLSAQVENLGNRGDTFGSNELQFMAARNDLMDQYRTKMESINQLQIQTQGQAGYTAESFDNMRSEAEQLKNINLDNLKQQFPDLATSVNQVAFGAFANLGGAVSNLIKGTGTLEDVFDQFTNSIIDGLADMAVKWAASQLFGLFMGAVGGGGGGGGGTEMSAAGSSLAGGFDNGGLIPGRFSGKPDQHVARVNPGEFVMRRESVARYGVGKMNAINMGRFDDGGFIGEAPKYRDYAAKAGDRSSQQSVKVEYSVTEINSVRYVSEEQFQRGLVKTSEQTEKRIRNSSRNSPSYRNGIGI